MSQNKMHERYVMEYWMSKKKKYAKLIKCSSKLICWNRLLKYSQYGHLNMNCKLEILANLKFLGYQICQQTVPIITKFYSHFQLKLKREDRNNVF